MNELLVKLKGLQYYKLKPGVILPSTVAIRKNGTVIFVYQHGFILAYNKISKNNSKRLKREYVKCSYNEMSTILKLFNITTENKLSLLDGSYKGNL